MADLVIRGALVCDGSGREAVRGDLAVTGDRIDDKTGKIVR